MARISSPVPEESLSCNVVPLLDIMFLLLMFLMLGSDMSERESADVKLAVADASKETDPRAKDRRVTLNVIPIANADPAAHGDASQWIYSFQGREFGVDALLARLTEAAQDELEPTETDGRRLSAVTLSIRCDRAAPYELVRSALGACAAAGIHRTELVAARPEEK